MSLMTKIWELVGTGRRFRRCRQSVALLAGGTGLKDGCRAVLTHTRTEGTDVGRIPNRVARIAAHRQQAAARRLFEAASRAPGGAQPEGSHLPERFEPTVAAWRTDLFSS